jgi:hypothetical protein
MRTNGQDQVRSRNPIHGAVNFTDGVVTREKAGGHYAAGLSCNCRLGKSGSAAIACLKVHHRRLTKILIINCEAHHGSAKPFAASFVPIGATRLERRRLK